MRLHVLSEVSPVRPIFFISSGGGGGVVRVGVGVGSVVGGVVAVVGVGGVGGLGVGSCGGVGRGCLFVCVFPVVSEELGEV